MEAFKQMGDENPSQPIIQPDLLDHVLSRRLFAAMGYPSVRSLNKVTMKIITACVSCLLLASSSAIAAAPDFESVTAHITKIIECPNPRIQPGYGTPKTPLYICYLGVDEYRKVFINDDGSGRIKNIKLMWDDRTKSMPPLPPVHAEKTEAKGMLEAVLKTYAPDVKDQIVKAFFLTKKPAKFDSAKYRIEFLYSQGPSMDERLLVLTPK